MRCNHHETEGRDTFGLPFPVLSIPCQCAATYRAIVAGEEIPKLAGYCAIVRESARHADTLERFASDLLVWDRYSLTEYDGPFLWVLRDQGTVLLRPIKRGDARFQGRLTVDGILRAFGEGGYWFWWDGSYLRAVTPEEAKALVRDSEEAKEAA